MEVTFIKAHPKFAYHAGETGDISEEKIEKYDLIEEGFVREAKKTKKDGDGKDAAAK